MEVLFSAIKMCIHSVKSIRYSVRYLVSLLFSFQSDWFGSSLYDLIHPDDVEKLREQLSTSESQNTGRILDLKSKFANNLNMPFNITNVLRSLFHLTVSTSVF